MERLDVFLTKSGYFNSRSRSQMEILAGNVKVNGVVATSNKMLVSERDTISISDDIIKYVSRAGLKLEKAKTIWELDFKDKVVLDIGSSTGGFTDFCLRSGAKKVYAVDVGVNQLDKSLKENKKVVSMESTDIRNIDNCKLPDVDVVVCDVSFISLKLIAHKIAEFLSLNGFGVILIKPQFECGKAYAKKCGGVVKDETVRKNIVEDIISHFDICGICVKDVTESPILGGDGNKEYLCLINKK